MGIFSKFKKNIAFVLVATLIVSTLMSFTSNASASAKTLTKNKLTGEELFAGLILGQGDFAKEFDTIWTEEMLKTSNSKEVKAQAKIALAEMKKVDPTYFDKLEKAVYSEDLNETYNLLQTGGTVFNKAIENINGKTIDSKNAISENCVTTTLAALATGVLVLVVTGAALVNTYWVYNYTVLKDKPGIVADGQMSLDQELFTRTMIENAVN
ncbi:sporulation delaying protein family toxin [Bacillus mycoides]|uniref:sporulation delaying protein family toxin n=1 Tax=Bacillus mycoides TaxID=1405 RepID=UPI0003E26DDC|nr:sporulation delaying protein family toxin [Bacillus mycoides]ETT84688.1 hypothetical protein C174_02329 [Bacillus mycoides FSL H7-687]